MPKGSEELTNARKEEIINACASLYETMGFKDITIQDMGNKTSFTRTSIYNYFRTKEEIFLALLQREHEAWAADLDGITEQHQDLSGEEFADALARTLEKRGCMLKLMSMNLYDMEGNSRLENLADFKKAYAGGYAVGAFNVNDMEMVQAIVEAADECRSPVILQVSAGARKYANPVYLRHLVQAAVETTNIPIVMHLDHGADFDICKASIDDGFTSVMIDASSKPWEENIAITKKVVEYAHDHGVVVEAELGKLAGVEDDVHVEADGALFTSPDEVEEFTSRTGIDSLAIAIGTSHGAYKFKPGQDPKLRLDILEEVGKRLPGFPIVLHGASSVPQDKVALVNKYGGSMPNAIGIPESELRKAAKMAVCKINIDSDLRVSFTAAVRQHFAEHPDHFDPRQYLGDARAMMKEMVKHKITDVLGCAGKA